MIGADSTGVHAQSLTVSNKSVAFPSRGGGRPVDNLSYVPRQDPTRHLTASTGGGGVLDFHMIDMLGCSVHYIW